MKLNFNDSIIIYPTEEGWKIILDDLLNNYSHDRIVAFELFYKRKVENNGYKCQFHTLITLHNKLFELSKDRLDYNFDTA